MRSMDAHAAFKGKKITVMGLGLLGGVGDIAFLAESGADLIVTDLKSEADAAPSLEALKQFSNVRYTLGRHELADFRGRDLIIKAPSTPADSPYIAEARKEGTPIAMWAALFAGFARETGATVVGVTGTRGKTTVTEMIVAILRAAGKPVIQGGNIRGTALLPRVRELTSGTIVVLELDSWKLQGFGEAHISPHVAVFTTLLDDHLNYYHGDRSAYLADKANIFLYQTPSDALILGRQCAATIIEKYGDKIDAQIAVADETKLPDTWALKIPGQHNRYDAALALAAARAALSLQTPGVGNSDLTPGVGGLDDKVAKSALEAFAGVPGRLQFVREVDGVKVYNDTTATTPDATLAALRALNVGFTKPNIILIMGGADKELDMNKLLYEIPNYTKRVILLAGTGTEKVRESLPGVPVFDSLAEAVEEAFARAVPGDTILFSPAFASFGMFKNEYDRGDQFDALVAAR